MSKRRTRQQVADAMSVSVQTIYNWETGKHPPTMPSLHRLARILGVTPDEILAKRLQLGPIAPVRGLVHAGAASADDFEDTIPIPQSIKAQHPSAFALVVAGDSLAEHGIHNGDLLLVDPDTPVDSGAICVVDVDGSYVAGTFDGNGGGDGSGRVRNSEGLDEQVPDGGAQLVGKVVWHLRRM